MNTWHEISEETYFTIYRELAVELHVFGTLTNLGAPAMPHLPKMILTEWGFEGQDFPLIKSEITDAGKKFFIIRGGSFV